jgi:hypothetical protein
MYLDRLCLYSYMTGKPLNELYALYQQNSWERLRYKDRPDTGGTV